MLSSNPTLQEVFDHVIVSLRKQKFASVKGEHTCLYRGNDGNKCAVGHCIIDELYLPSMEEMGIYKTIDEIPTPFSSPELAWMFEVPANDLLTKLQNCHDSLMPRENHPSSDHMNAQKWEERMQDIAFKFKLVYTLPTQEETNA
jgi:hypothetical protein